MSFELLFFVLVYAVILNRHANRHTSLIWSFIAKACSFIKTRALFIKKMAPFIKKLVDSTKTFAIYA